MLAALEQQVKNLRTFTGETDYAFGALSTDRYAEFRSKSGEIYTLSIVVRARVENLDSGPDAELQERFDRLVVEAQRIIIGASLRFMDVLSKLTDLPLGAREIFTSELRALHDAHMRLKDPRLQSYIDEQLEKKLSTAEAVLHTIIERAPQLLSFGQK